jgi:hypothetical protein
MRPANTPRLWSRLTGRGRRWAGWVLADLAAGTLPAARIVMLTGITEVHHG